MGSNPTDDFGVKFKSVGKVGERANSIVVISDPSTLSSLDEVIEWSRASLTERYGTPKEHRYKVNPRIEISY